MQVDDIVATQSYPQGIVHNMPTQAGTPDLGDEIWTYLPCHGDVISGKIVSVHHGLGFDVMPDVEPEGVNPEDALYVPWSMVCGSEADAYRRLHASLSRTVKAESDGLKAMSREIAAKAVALEDT